MGRPKVKPGETGIQLGAEIRHRLPALKALTSLRFFAAIYVAVYHLAAGHSLVGWTPVENFISSGDTGVSLFFILSGFILAYNYRKIDSLREFWTSRFARIYPVYLVALLFSFAYSFAPAAPSPDHRALRLGLTLTLLQSWYQPYAESFNGPGWTLSVEAFFYALFPFVLRGVSQIKSPVRTPVEGRTFALICVAYVACLCVAPEIVMIAAGSRAAAAVAGFLVASRLPVLHLPLFLIGAYLGKDYAAYHYAAYHSATEQGVAANVERERHTRSRPVLYLAATGSLALLCAGPSGIYEPARRSLLALCYAALIYGLAYVRGGLLTSRWMVLAGEISYSIYILQMPVFRTVLGVARRLKMGPYESIGSALATLTFVSYFAYRFIELPARVSIRRRLIKRPVRLAKI